VPRAHRGRACQSSPTAAPPCCALDPAADPNCEPAGVRAAAPWGAWPPARGPEAAADGGKAPRFSLCADPALGSAARQAPRAFAAEPPAGASPRLGSALSGGALGWPAPASLSWTRAPGACEDCERGGHTRSALHPLAAHASRGCLPGPGSSRQEPHGLQAAWPSVCQRAQVTVRAVLRIGWGIGSPLCWAHIVMLGMSPVRCAAAACMNVQSPPRALMFPVSSVTAGRRGKQGPRLP